MPRFDQIAQAANTPGGFQAGVNDIVAAIMGADAEKFKAAKQAEADAASSDLNKQKMSEMIRANAAQEGLRSQDIAGDEAFRRDSLGETIRHNGVMEQRPVGGAGTDPSLVEQRGHAIDRSDANTMAGMVDDNTAWIDQEIPPDPLAVNGKPTFKKVRGPASDTQMQMRDAEFARLRAARANASAGGQGATGQKPQGRGSVLDGVMPDLPKAGGAPTSPGARPIPVPLGNTADQRAPVGPQTGVPTPPRAEGKAGNAPVSPGAQPTEVPLAQGASKNLQPLQSLRDRATGVPIDFDALDAKYQELSPAYRQKRSSPTWNWKKFLQDNAAQ
jgi:hypothetical protein